MTTKTLSISHAIYMLKEYMLYIFTELKYGKENKHISNV